MNPRRPWSLRNLVNDKLLHLNHLFAKILLGVSQLKTVKWPTLRACSVIHTRKRKYKRQKKSKSMHIWICCIKKMKTSLENSKTWEVAANIFWGKQKTRIGQSFWLICCPWERIKIVTVTTKYEPVKLNGMFASFERILNYWKYDIVWCSC